jgi:hypothetical protein
MKTIRQTAAAKTKQTSAQAEEPGQKPASPAVSKPRVPVKRTLAVKKGSGATVAAKKTLAKTAHPVAKKKAAVQPSRAVTAAKKVSATKARPAARKPSRPAASAAQNARAVSSLENQTVQPTPVLSDLAAFRKPNGS